MRFSVKQWVKASIASLLYLLFAFWVGNFWILIGLPFLIDIYLTKYVPWTFWRKWKDSPAKTVMEWVDAIGFALIAVYFINTFFFQNYKIPSSSLEKSLLVGDFLFVSKVSFGARVPNTPLSFPLAQHTLPVLNCKSFIEWPQWEYKRLTGFGQVKRNDIVVFNFPTGDTVTVKLENPDYYTSCFYEGLQQMRQMGEYFVKDSTDYTQYANRAIALGREVVKNRPDVYGKIVYRPVDRRENYVKRCVGLPGDVLQIINNQVYINGKKGENPEMLQLNYYVETNGSLLTDEVFRNLDVSKDDQEMVSDGELLQSVGIRQNANGQYNPVYHLPLTHAALTKLKAMGIVAKVVVEPGNLGGPTFPLNYSKRWAADNYGPLWIPRKGSTIKLNINNLPLYERAISTYEGNTLEVKEGKIYINNKIADRYTFRMDYYWMMGDNRHKSADSRFWGFVPEDHIVGKPILIWLSLDKDRSFFDGGVRWNRIFKLVHK